MTGSSSVYLATAAGSALAQPLITHVASAFQTDGRTTGGGGGGKQEMAATRPFGGAGSEERGLKGGPSGAEEQWKGGSAGIVGEEVAGGVWRWRVCATGGPFLRQLRVRCARRHRREGGARAAPPRACKHR
ncbi:hypothetical protein I4F81_009540 [Pyropia yezoensis]|uniref:Uncharacterized protein n=1 Tax=Pyropia yezoensis TaxID=2788 RepID=A0ACC3CA00_PYRYE|nr:hypothetical protein I4F81_009540 [Neopyropia yezoensis]